MTENKSKFSETARTVAITLTAIVIVYYAFEIFKNKHVDFGNTAGFAVLVINLIYLVLHKPALPKPNAPVASQAPETK